MGDTEKIKMNSGRKNFSTSHRAPLGEGYLEIFIIVKVPAIHVVRPWCPGRICVEKQNNSD
jgi:hypothetical protein